MDPLMLPVEPEGVGGSSVRGSSEDGASGSPSTDSDQKTRIMAKIEKTKQKLLKINVAREADVEEFLSMTNKAEMARGMDNPQLARIRQHFEKRNKKHTHDTEVLQKKLAQYEQKLNDTGNVLDTSSRSARMISTVGHGIRQTGANLKEMTGNVIAAPLELAQKLKSTFGSADNLPDDPPPDAEAVGHSLFYSNSVRDRASSATTKAKSSTLPAGHRVASSGALLSPPRALPSTSEESARETPIRLKMDERAPLPTPCAGFTDDMLKAMLAEIKDLRQHNISIVQHMDTLQERVEIDLARNEKALQEERFKYQRLEDTLNDSIDIHRAEVERLKSDLANVASRIDYQYNDRFKRVEENLENTQHHMSRMELFLKESVNLKDGVRWYNALLLSGATILVELLKIFLYLTAVVLDFFRPFTGTRTKAGLFLCALFAIAFILQNTDVLCVIRGLVTSSNVSDPSSSLSPSSSPNPLPTSPPLRPPPHSIPEL